MIPRMQRSEKHERFALGEISLDSNNAKDRIIGQRRESVKKPGLKQISFNESDKERLSNLRSKYSKISSIQNLENIPSSGRSRPMETSFKSINLENFDKKDNLFQISSKSNQVNPSAGKSVRSSYLQNQFEKKIQQSNHRLESNFDRVEDKLNFLRQSYQKRNSFSKNQFSHTSSQSKIERETQPNRFFVEDSIQKPTQLSNTYNKSSPKRAYAQQLKSINFIDEIKRKIQEIEKETKTNLEKKASQISKNSKASFENIQYQAQNKTQKITLANLAPNLAQSEVIDTVQRDRFYEKNLFQKQQHFGSLVFQNYNFGSAGNSLQKPNFSEKIMEDPEIQQVSIRVSPILSKSPFREKNLEETQMIERNQLQGDFQIVEEEIQREFVLLINRLAYQAQIDNKLSSEIFKYDNIFTQKQSLKSIILERLKQHYAQNQLIFDQKMFQVSQMELDPLVTVQKTQKDFSSEEIMKVGFSLKKLYDKNTFYFQTKLLKSYNPKTIDFFIDELQKCHALKAEEEFNVGHLTSYVNMRTGKNLRNRYFYRILKRIVKSQRKTGSLFKRSDLMEAFVKQ